MVEAKASPPTAVAVLAARGPRDVVRANAFAVARAALDDYAVRILATLHETVSVQQRQVL